jgi:catechol 2,3-dioxygenase-like lactoylglutathione lyase family enzyme
MITSVHTLVYSDDPSATRAFLRDVLGWPYVEDTGSEPGWLIFRSGPSEMGVHPTSGTWEGGEYSHTVHHELSLMCDDISATKAELESKGAVFDGGVEDHGFGLVAMMQVPGAGNIMLYEPRHDIAYGL